MKAFTTVLSVAEIHAARAFYEDLFGLELYQDYGRNLTFTCGLSLQQDFHWLTGLSRAQIHPQPNNMELAFETEDLDGFLQKLRAYPHLQTLGGVVEHPWGQRVIRFYDLDGHLIEVGESMKLVIRRFQAAGMTPEEIAQVEIATDTPESLQRETADGLTLEGMLGTDAPEEGMVERIALRESIDQLPEKERMTILLRYFKGLTQEQTARILGVSQVQVSRLERRGLKRLREFLSL